jgi:UDP-N-acetylglucosamine/UDP-N-acetylgalactosamine diphosphorylase
MGSDLGRRYEQARETLKDVGQEHILSFFDRLDDRGRADLLTQIEGHDWPRLAQLVETYVRRAPELRLPQSIEPAPCYPAEPPSELRDRYEEARRLGEKLIGAGKVAAFTVAGGQGTRLGWEGPKGTFPATPVKGKPLFQVFAESILKTRRKYQTQVPWYIMTSPANDAVTRAFFADHNYFGLHRGDVTFFAQGTIPSFSLEGKALLAGPSRLATNPDGHGGSLKALHASGALRDMIRRGIEHISYFQVDNPLVRCVDPLFIGLHALDGAQMSSKMVIKARADEKVGVFALVDGRINVIEYSDLPQELNEARNADGSLRFAAGSIAIHAITVAFVERLNAGGFALPYHRAVKKVSHIDITTGRPVDPAEPNAVKLETFVFDALQFCDRSIVLQTLREEEFGPIKNAEGADSPQTSMQLQSDRAARWLESAGVAVPKFNGRYDATIELSPLTAIEPQDLLHAPVPPAIGTGQMLVL